MADPIVKLKWDETGEKFYESGVDHAVLYPMDSSGAYTNGVVWNGITAVTESPSGGEANDLWADNIKYASLRSAETFGFTIEAYMYPDEFAACDGSVEISAGVKIGQQDRKKFGFSYRTKIGNDSNTDAFLLHLIWGASATPSEKNYQTINDSPDAITFSWECDTVPVPVTGHKPVSSMTIDSRKVSPEAMDAIMINLYGDDPEASTGINPHLPTPDEILEIIAEADSEDEDGD